MERIGEIGALLVLAERAFNGTRILHHGVLALQQQAKEGRHALARQFVNRAQHPFRFQDDSAGDQGGVIGEQSLGQRGLLGLIVHQETYQHVRVEGDHVSCAFGSCQSAP